MRKIPDRIVDEDKLKRAEDTVRRYGGRAVFIGRFTAALRALVPGTAGMSGVPYGRFLVWNALGGAIWATAYVMIGYLAGSQYKHIEQYANYIGIAVVIVIVLVLLVRRRKRRNDTADSVKTRET